MTDQINKILIDPAKVDSLSKEELVKLYDQTRYFSGELYAQQKALSELLVEKINKDGEIVGKFAVTKAKRVSFFPDLKAKEKLAKAKELGAVKEAVDSTVLKRLFEQGVEIPHEVTKYVIVKEIEK